jgi:hypothetical protein
MDSYHLAFDLWNTTAYSLPSDPLFSLANILQIESLSLDELQTLLHTRKFSSLNYFSEICELLQISYVEHQKNKFDELIKQEREQFKLFQDTLPSLKIAKSLGSSISLISNLWNFCMPSVHKHLLSAFDFDYTFFHLKLIVLSLTPIFFKLLKI